MIEPLSFLNMAVFQRGVNPDSSPDEFSALMDVPLFIGYMLSYLLQGILFVQMFLYCLVFRRTDPIYLRITVLLIFMVELASTLIATVIVIESIVLAGYLAFSVALQPAFTGICILCGLAATMVQGSYAWRIHLLGGSWKITVPIMILSVTQCVMVSYWGSLDEEAGLLELAGTKTIHSASAVFTAWLVSSTICDIMITITLFYLRKQIQSTQSQSLIVRVQRAMTIAIDTGVLTAIGASFQLLLFLSLENSLIDMTLFYALPKLYSNSLMATLNARIIVKAGTFPDDNAEVEDKLLEYGAGNKTIGDPESLKSL
ncbi:hypothetical protein BDP27DRAFT_1340532 [Rhodocollybia butyracea]|uniref:DUF6534 domain-containing protein n=1 Tax=Rhodocollybia butyracea TaxID=206335 RepID=A0A9P5TZV3_9AGAR|nr:hypothetical protein BDP27DRAFT_1340532 [Rhodocollybia butyracea]